MRSAATRPPAASWRRAPAPTSRPAALSGRARGGARLAAAFHAAMVSGDTATLARLPAEDAVLHSDGGGKRAAALNPIRGADKIIRFFAAIARKEAALVASETRPATINGLAGFVIREPDGSLDTVAFEARDGRITAIYLTRNPDKLRYVRF